ncbi:MAG: class I SAM-dependent methyltransferase [Chloroflexi bacterium]|nr:class I SAM-dependent methyltransferase [Chloroflexota bacterium]
MNPLFSDYATKARWKAITPFVHGNVLDIGCGWTKLPDILTNNQVYVGIDIASVVLEYCTKRYPQHTFCYRNLDVEPLALSQYRFNTAIMAAVIEHLQFPQCVLRQVRALLASDGLLIVTTPSPLGNVVHQIGSRIGLFYPESVVKHVQIFGRRALLSALSECGYQVIHYRVFLMGMNQLVVCRPLSKM